MMVKNGIMFHEAQFHIFQIISNLFFNKNEKKKKKKKKELFISIFFFQPKFLVWRIIMNSFFLVAIVLFSTAH